MPNIKFTERKKRSVSEERLSTVNCPACAKEMHINSLTRHVANTHNVHKDRIPLSEAERETRRVARSLVETASAADELSASGSLPVLQVSDNLDVELIGVSEPGDGAADVCVGGGAGGDGQQLAADATSPADTGDTAVADPSAQNTLSSGPYHQPNDSRSVAVCWQCK